LRGIMHGPVPFVFLLTRARLVRMVSRMTYRLFLDDDRFPPDSDSEGWVIVRTVDDAIATVREHGMPRYIAFDHDLGKAEGGAVAPKAMVFCRWLENYVLDTKPDLTDFGFYVHSQNPIGARNIEGLMNPLIAYARAGYP
jgi:hypothetical protein